MLSRLVKNVWNLDSFIKEVENKYPTTFSKEALEVIFYNAEDYPGYFCIEELTRDFEEWTLEKFASFINDKYRENIKPEQVWEFIYGNFTNRGEESTNENIIKLLTSTILLHPNFKKDYS